MSFPVLRHFHQGEFKYPFLIDPALLLLVDEARDQAGDRIYVKSDVRKHEDMVRIYGPQYWTWPDSPHQIRDDGLGHGLDLRMVPWNGTTRHRFVKACLRLEWEGRWPNQGIEIADNHVHVDNDPVLRRPWLWVGLSR